jgi:hypothetical protein
MNFLPFQGLRLSIWATESEASVGGSFASQSRVPARAEALVLVDSVQTSAAVETRDDGGAIIFDQFAIGSSVLGRTGAEVGTLASVEAGAAVLAGLVIGAVVEILIAKQTAPTHVAVALPRLLARAVHTAWIADALVAQLSLPSQFAPIKLLFKFKINHFALTHS